MDYQIWDLEIQKAVGALSDDQATERAQKFLKQFPQALTQFRSHLDSRNDLTSPLADFQRHPTYLLRFMLAEWKDEETKTFRTDFKIILEKGATRLLDTQRWRNGEGDNWKTWGYSSMNEMYDSLSTTPEMAEKIDKWFFQRFVGLDVDNHPLHVEILPNNFQPDLIKHWVLRRVVNNEHTLRHRLILLNPPPSAAMNGMVKLQGSSSRADYLSNPILGATWVVDAQRLSLWYSAAIYKTANSIIDLYVKENSRHYPEQGYRAKVINLGVVFGTMYNIFMKVMPPTVQSSTQCFIGREALDQLMGGEAAVPAMMKNPKQTRLTTDEEARFKHDIGPFDDRARVSSKR